MAVSSDARSFYHLLGVPRTASPDEIRAAFRERAKLYHPDGGGADEERFRALREAYEVLRDPQRRLQYDAEELEAERERDRARWAGAGGPAGAAASGVPGPGFPGLLRRWLLPGLVAAMVVALVVALVSLVQRGQELESLRAELSSLQDEQAATRSIVPAPAGEEALYRTAILFPPATAELDEGLMAQLEARLAELRSAIDALPAGEGWSVTIDGRSPRAASEAGVAVEEWELALLRVATVTEYLVRAAGIPADRLTVRFEAGSAAGAGEGIELSLLCCGS